MYICESKYQKVRCRIEVDLPAIVCQIDLYNNFPIYSYLPKCGIVYLALISHDSQPR